MEAKKEKILSNNAEDFPAELHEARWSVISFSKAEAIGLSYTEAEQKIKELEAQNVSGLCIVTDEVAERLNREKT